MGISSLGRKRDTVFGAGLGDEGHRDTSSLDGPEQTMSNARHPHHPRPLQVEQGHVVDGGEAAYTHLPVDGGLRGDKNARAWECGVEGVADEDGDTGRHRWRHGLGMDHLSCEPNQGP